jgi:hypothetical protein
MNMYLKLWNEIVFGKNYGIWMIDLWDTTAERVCLSCDADKELALKFSHIKSVVVEKKNRGKWHGDVVAWWINLLL